MSTAPASLFERAVSLAHLRLAWQQEVARQGPPGSDRQSVDAFSRQANDQLQRLHTELTKQTYQCRPVLRRMIPKKSGGLRPLGICTVRDRIVQRALLAVLAPVFEQRFLDCSHAFRSKRSPQTALRQIQNLQTRGMSWAYEADIEDCFGSVQSDLLQEELDAVSGDIRLHQLIDKIIQSGALEHGVVYWDYLGLPQGSPLSPLLANIYLHPFDVELVSQGYDLVRYADDFLILTQSEAQADVAGCAAERALQHRLMRPNPHKTRIVSLADGVDFLGFSIDTQGLRPHPKAIQSLTARLREILQEEIDESSPHQRLSALRDVLRGWRTYFPSFGSFFPEHPEIALAALEIALEKKDTQAIERFLPLADVTQLSPLRSVWQRAAQRAQEQLSTCADRSFSQTEANAQPHGHALGTFGSSVLGGVSSMTHATSLSSPLVPTSSQRLSLSEDMSPLAAKIAWLRHQLHQNPADVAIHYELADVYMQAGQIVSAHSVLQYIHLPAEQPPVPVVWPPDGPFLSLSASAEESFFRLFQGKDGMLARAIAQRDGRIQYQPFPARIQPALLREHWAGHFVGGLYPIQEQGLCSVAGLEIAVSRRTWQRHLHEPQRLQEYTQQAHLWLLSVAQHLQQAHLSFLLEHPGGYDRKLWLFLQKPTPLKRVQALLQLMVQSAPVVPSGLSVVCFPERSHPADGDPGRPLPFPLGAHLWSGFRSAFLDPVRGTPCSPEHALALVAPVDPDALAAPWQKRQQLQGNADFSERFPHAQKLARSCLVLRSLLDKLQATHYLEHAERVSLLYTFGHLDAEGADFLHASLRVCHDYDPSRLDRWITQRRPFPISCPRLREKHADLLQGSPCQCLFRRVPRHGYPTPLLHVLPTQQVFALHKPQESIRPHVVPQPHVPIRPHVALRSDVPPKPKPVTPDITASPRSSLPTDIDTEKISAWIRQFAELQKHQAGVQRSLLHVTNQLAQMMDGWGSDVLSSPVGTIRRTRQADGSYRWTMEPPIS